MGRFHHHNHAHAHDEHAHDEHAHDEHGLHEHDGVWHRHDDHDDHDDQRDVGDHTGYETGGMRVEVLEKILGENDRTAASNRAAFRAAGVRVVNVMSSPGAGKTTLLAGLFSLAHGDTRFGVIEGDIETAIDADRLAATGVAVSLVNTANGFGGECHLDAPMVRSALPRLPLDDLDVVVIENVGNLVCPAEFDVGEDARLMVFSITEGEEKPLKYPVMFRSADAIVINKMDLLPHLDFDLDAFLANVESVNPGVQLFHTSAKTGDGFGEVLAWLRGEGGDPTV